MNGKKRRRNRQGQSLLLLRVSCWFPFKLEFDCEMLYLKQPNPLIWGSLGE